MVVFARKRGWLMLSAACSGKLIFVVKCFRPVISGNISNSRTRFSALIFFVSPYVTKLHVVLGLMKQ